MSASYDRVHLADNLEQVNGFIDSFALDVLVGLSESPKQLPSKYFYDDRGSELFQKIMESPDYYLTDCEFDILANQQSEFADLIKGETFNLVELGAGDGRKTSLLIDYFLQQNSEFQYVPIDISEGAMRYLTRLLDQKFPALKTKGIIAEYFQGLKWLQANNQRRNMVLFLGSNLGNFNKAQSKSYLRSLWNTLNDGDYVVIGFDLKKDIELMLKAYNDSAGITREFNLNLLTRINRELGGNFDLSKFRHYSTYDVFSGAMESYLVSLEHQNVFIETIGQIFSFEAWEPIHTEFSYKYLESDIQELADSTGYTIVKQLYDSKHYFVDSIWRVVKIDSLDDVRKLELFASPAHD